jgi:hypothetical protein
MSNALPSRAAAAEGSTSTAAAHPFVLAGIAAHTHILGVTWVHWPVSSWNFQK